MNHSKLPVNSQLSHLPSVFRIIAGTWRSRKFQFPPTPGLRPTPDRVRETLFNWLADVIPDAVCLDLFCGSGALGLEALSRGAKHCTFIDAETRALQAINQHLQVLNCTQGSTITCALPEGLSRFNHVVDVVFLDPPYSLPCITDCLNALVSMHLLSGNAFVYIECSSKDALPVLPDNFRLHRHKRAGQVQYALLHYAANSSLCLEDPL
jgi:16S rRNA (guanine966-N2)-methyltransferase